MTMSKEMRYYYRNRESEIKRTAAYRRKQRMEDPEFREKDNQRQRFYQYIQMHPDLFPLDDKCIFCGRTQRLEHGHLDYENEGHNYVTVCHQCNGWMEK